MILAVDFDDTIHDPRNREKGYKLGKPMPNAVHALNELSKQGHTIIVHSVWADTPKGQEEIRNWMQYFHIPCHNVTAKKPAADIYIDDRGYHFDNWIDTMAELDMLSDKPDRALEWLEQRDQGLAEYLAGLDNPPVRATHPEQDLQTVPPLKVWMPPEEREKLMETLRGQPPL